MKAFETWTHNGTRFLAANRGSDVFVIDENGGNYGTWGTAEDFRRRQKKGDEIAKAFEQSQARLMVQTMPKE